ncbi:unnamed protein product [Clonostachys byssicola]|uniref:Uncharacterized protein n=1 Tax=Clonostachys byssicola TaxID=160290 RepID=A0A9N9YD36_9HYPO|nr:unnamed protein product [Clonostachys byssicola]
MKFYSLFSVSFVLLSAGTSALKPYPQDANAVRRGTLAGRAAKVPTHIARARPPRAQAARPKIKTPSSKAGGAKEKKAGAAKKPKAPVCKVKGKLGKRANPALPGTCLGRKLEPGVCHYCNMKGERPKPMPCNPTEPCRNDIAELQGCVVSPNPRDKFATCGLPSPPGDPEEV